jgi:hypothetical protein
MKAILKYNLPDEQTEFEDATNGLRWKLSMWELDQWLRAQYKYMPDAEYSEAAYNAYEKSRERLFEILNENGLSLN